MTYLTPSTPVTSGVSTIGSTTQSARQTQPLERSETNPSHVTSQMQAPIRHLTSVDLAFAMTNDLAPVGRVDFSQDITYSQLSDWLRTKHPIAGDDQLLVKVRDADGAVESAYLRTVDVNYDEHIEEVTLREEELSGKHAELLQQTLPEGKPPWKVVLAHIAPKDADTPRYAVLFPVVHHSLADGMRGLQQFLESADEPTSIRGVGSAGQSAPKSLLQNIRDVAGILVGSTGYLGKVADLLIRPADIGPLKAPNRATDSTPAVIRGQSIPYESIRKYARDHKVPVSAVLLGCFAHACAQIYAQHENSEVTSNSPPIVRLALVMKTAAAENSNNNVLSNTLNLPMASSDTLQQRVEEMASRLKSPAQHVERLVNATLIKQLAPYPKAFERVVHNQGSRAITGVVSPLPGPKEEISFFGGNKVKWAGWGIPLKAPWCRDIISVQSITLGNQLLPTFTVPSDLENGQQLMNFYEQALLDIGKDYPIRSRL